MNSAFRLRVQVRHELAVLVVRVSVLGEHLDPLGEIGDHHRSLGVVEVPGIERLGEQLSRTRAACSSRPGGQVG